MKQELHDLDSFPPSNFKPNSQKFIKCKKQNIQQDDSNFDWFLKTKNYGVKLWPIICN